MITGYLGIDVGSVSTNIVLLSEQGEIIDRQYIRTSGKPIAALQQGMASLRDKYEGRIKVLGVGTTGSGRRLAGVLVGADVVKNEITAHAVAALKIMPEVRTILEIGGQDSKIILLRNGVVVDFAMNTVCAAGTGSFLDRQAARLEIPIEEFGSYALRSVSPVRIAGRCAVFAESDMIHKQQTGHTNEDIIAGLCEALVRNFLNNLAKGKSIEEPIIFQGGVAANVGIKAAFEKALGKKIYVPQNHDVMGAVGAAWIAKEEMKPGQRSRFTGFNLSDKKYSARSLECNGCSNACEVVKIYSDDYLIACWGDRCGKWANMAERADTLRVESDSRICYN